MNKILNSLRIGNAKLFQVTLVICRANFADICYATLYHVDYFSLRSHSYFGLARMFVRFIEDFLFKSYEKLP